MSKVQTDVSGGVNVCEQEHGKIFNVRNGSLYHGARCRQQNDDSGTRIEIDQVRMFNLDSSLFSIVPT